MLKSSLLSTLIVSSSCLAASLTSSEETLATFSKVISDSSVTSAAIKKALHDHSKAEAAVKSLKLSSSAVSLHNHAALSQSAADVRTLRGGKTGKGKNKEKPSGGGGGGGGDDASAVYLNIEYTYCAGNDYGFPLSSDWTYQSESYRVGNCMDIVDSDGYTYSSKYIINADPFSIAEEVYNYYGCEESNFYATVPIDVTDILALGGGSFNDGVCVPRPGQSPPGFRGSITTTPVTVPAGIAAVVWTASVSVDSCLASVAAGTSFASTVFQVMNFPSFFPSVIAGLPICSKFEDSASPLWYHFVSDLCPSYLMKFYSDSSCAIQTSTETEPALYCYFDVQSFYDDWTDEGAEITYSSQYCLAGA